MQTPRGIGLFGKPRDRRQNSFRKDRTYYWVIRQSTDHEPAECGTFSKGLQRGTKKISQIILRFLLELEWRSQVGKGRTHDFPLQLGHSALDMRADCGGGDF